MVSQAQEPALTLLFGECRQTWTAVGYQIAMILLLSRQIGSSPVAVSLDLDGIITAARAAGKQEAHRDRDT